MAVETAEQHVSAAEEEEQPESDDEEAGSESTDSSSEGSEPHEVKKKKKKKKKKRSGGGAAAAAAHPPVDPAARKEGERRLQDAVELLSLDSEEGMWVKLGGCHLADGKLKRLCEALKSNTTCISLDLSDNNLTDEGARALAAALADGRAPDLLELDLRDNPQILEGGSTALEELQQRRRTLRVALGPSAPPPQPPQPQQQGDGPRGQAAKQVEAEGHANGGATLADSVKSNPVISKYFSVGNDDADEDDHQMAAGQGQAPGQEEGQEQLGGLSAAELARMLWDQLEQSLDAPQPSIPAISEPLRAIAEQVEHEMDNCVLPMLPSTEVGELKTFTQWALRKLHLLHSVLDLVPPPLLTPYSKTVPVPAVGTHRAAAAELLAQLLRGDCPSIALAVAASGVLRRCAALAVAHPNCSPLHGAVGRCLRVALSPAVGPVGLWQQLLGSAPAGARAGAASADRGASLNLAAEAAAMAAAAAAAPTVGKRPANAGFALAVGQMLHAAATGEVLGAGSGGGGEEGGGHEAPGGSTAAASPDGQAAGDAHGLSSGGQAPPDQQPQARQQQQQAGQQADDPLAGPNPLARGLALARTPSQLSLARVASAAVAELPEEQQSWEVQLRAHLEAQDVWTEFATGPECLLRRLLGEHVGDLGAPRPRPGMTLQPEEPEGTAAGQTISGQELLMMLRGLNLGGFSGGI